MTRRQILIPEFKSKVYRLVKRGGIQVLRIGKTWRFSKDLMDQWVRQSKEASAEDFNENTAGRFYWKYYLELR